MFFVFLIFAKMLFPKSCFALPFLQAIEPDDIALLIKAKSSEGPQSWINMHILGIQLQESIAMMDMPQTMNLFTCSSYASTN